jgi:hypothetical protein
VTDLLSRAKAAIEAGEQHLRDAFKRLLVHKTRFKATPREIAGQASECKEQSLFRPTTKADRVFAYEAAARQRDAKTSNARDRRESSAPRTRPMFAAAGMPVTEGSADFLGRGALAPSMMNRRGTADRHVPLESPSPFLADAGSCPGNWTERAKRWNPI